MVGVAARARNAGDRPGMSQSGRPEMRMPRVGVSA